MVLPPGSTRASRPALANGAPGVAPGHRRAGEKHGYARWGMVYLRERPLSSMTERRGHMRSNKATLLLLSAALPLLSGCPTEPPPRAKEPVMVEDEWSKTPHSQEWLHATANFSGDHKAECAEVLSWVKGEESCKGSLCEHGRELAGEWITRCPKYADPDALADAKVVRAKLTERVAEKPTACGTELDGMLASGCGDDKTCEA